MEDWKWFSSAEHQKCGFGKKLPAKFPHAGFITPLSKPDYNDFAACLALLLGVSEQAAVTGLISP